MSDYFSRGGGGDDVGDYKHSRKKASSSYYASSPSLSSPSFPADGLDSRAARPDDFSGFGFGPMGGAASPMRRFDSYGLRSRRAENGRGAEVLGVLGVSSSFSSSPGGDGKKKSAGGAVEHLPVSMMAEPPRIKARSPLVDSPLDVRRADNATKNWLQPLFLLGCSLVLFSFWAPVILRMAFAGLCYALWATLSNPIYLGVAAVGVGLVAHRYLGVLKTREKKRKRQMARLTTQQRRLIGLGPDPMSAKADKMEAEKERERRRKIYQDARNEAQKTTSYLSEIDDADVLQQPPLALRGLQSPLRAQNTSYSSYYSSYSPGGSMRLGQDIDFDSLIPSRKKEGSFLENLRREDRSAVNFRYRSSKPVRARNPLEAKGELPRKLDSHVINNFAFKSEELMSRLRVSRNGISNWPSNVKQWIVDTIMKPLLRDFRESDSRFRVKADQMKKDKSFNTEQQRIVHHLPSFIDHIVTMVVNKKYVPPELGDLVPEVRKRIRLQKYVKMDGANKETILRRLREFGSSLSTSSYKWDYSSSDKCPTDAQIVMHIFVTWMSEKISQFRYYCFIPHGQDRPARDSKFPSIRECYTKPPYYCIMASKNDLHRLFGSTTDSLVYVKPWRENVFYCIAMFLYVLKRAHGGLLLNTELSSRSLHGLANVLSTSRYNYDLDRNYGY